MGVGEGRRVQRRLVFGETDELYHRYRPAHPDALIDNLVRLAELDGRRQVLEVGAGTGKATAMFAARGIPVLAVEPSPEMTTVLRTGLAGHGGVRIEHGDFETWEPGS